jgi:hypothetical protein
MLMRSEKYSEAHCWFEAWGASRDARIRGYVREKTLKKGGLGNAGWGEFILNSSAPTTLTVGNIRQSA